MTKIFIHCKNCPDKPADELIDLNDENYCRMPHIDLEGIENDRLH